MNAVVTEPTVVLVGNPNCGKTALFNALTGSRQRVTNYAGVTVERKEGFHTDGDGNRYRVVDLPGVYSLSTQSPDEMVAKEAMLGRTRELGEVHVLVALVDATNLERSLGLVLELVALGKPMVVACNMMDLAKARGLDVDFALLEKELGVPVIPTVATKRKGLNLLFQAVSRLLRDGSQMAAKPSTQTASMRFERVDAIIKKSVRRGIEPDRWTRNIDRIVLHPVGGVVILLGILTLMFQAVFTWAAPFQDAIEGAFGAAQNGVVSLLGSGALSDLLSQGILAGVGGVLVFLPQIMILFAFILVLEDSGYLARAAFLLDRLMSRFGLSGRSVIPLLSSFACAIPGVMATRTIPNRAERMTTLLVAPLTTCSARLPVYALLISAFIPAVTIGPGLQLQGLVLLGLYLLGIAAPLAVALVLRFFFFKEESQGLVLELPTYKWPLLKDVLIGMLQRARSFVERAGTVILTLSILIWFLSTYPRGDITQSFAGQLGHFLEPLLAPLGFDWRIALGLIPGMAAREVMVSALGTIYAVEQGTEGAEAALGVVLAQQWTLATALSLLVWFVFAPQCISTLAVIRRETQSYRWPVFVFFYMLVLAYAASWVTYQISVGLMS